MDNDNTKKQVVLLIEPDKNLRSFYSIPLNNSGNFKTIIAASAKEALQTIETTKSAEIQLILLDTGISDIPFQILLQKIIPFLSQTQ